MAKYDHGGGCPCGLQRECNCGYTPKRRGAFIPGQSAEKPTNPKDAVGIRKAPMSTVSAPFLVGVGTAMMEGAVKYGRHNYRVAGVRSSVYYDAAMRHLMSWWEGEDIDPDSGLPHIIKAAACLAVLYDSLAYGNLNDDRPPPHKTGWLAPFNKVAGDLLDKFPEPKAAYTAADRAMPTVAYDAAV